jgi:outer membrane protein TolC
MIKISGMEESAAEAKANGVISGYLPQINAYGSYSDYEQLPMTLLSSEGFTDFIRLINAHSKLITAVTRQPLPVATLPSYIKSYAGGVQFQTNMVLELSQVIYSQQLIEGIKTAKKAVEVNKLQTVRNKEELAYNVSRLYYAIYVGDRQMKIAQQNLANIEKLIEHAKIKFDSGLMKETDFEKITINKTNAEILIQNLQTFITQQKNTLRLLLGFDITTEFSIADTIDCPKIEDSTFAGFDKRTDYKILKMQEELVRMEKSTNNAGYLPGISAFAQIGQQYLSETFKKSFSDYDNTFKVAGIKMQIPVFDGLSKFRKNEQSDIKLREVEAQCKYLKSTIITEINNTLTKYNSSYEVLKAQERNMGVAEKVYNQSFLEFKNGLVSLTDLLLADSSLKETQGNYLTSLVNYFLADTDLKKAKGSIVSQFNIN